MMKRDGHSSNYLAQRSTSPIKALNPTIEIIIMVEIVRLRTKVYHSMNSCTTFVHLGPYMLVCACVYNILSHTMSLFLWWRLENYLDIWLISLVVMAWVSLMLKVSSKWGMSQICWLLKNLDLTCCILCLVENSGEKSYMLNFYLPLALTSLPLIISSFWWRDHFWRLMPKGEKYWERV